MEKRRFKRFSVGSMEIHGRILFSTDIDVLNISVGGLAFSTDKYLTMGGIYVLRLESKGSSLFLQGTIVWSKQHKNFHGDTGTLPVNHFGMKFLHASDTQRRDIEKFIRDHFVEYQRIDEVPKYIGGIRIHVRCHINNPEKAVINCSEGYKLKKISQSGILIESANLLKTGERVPMQMTLAERKHVTFWGRIVTCHAIQMKERLLYDIGIEFVEMTEKDRVMLGDFIHSLETQKAS